MTLHFTALEMDLVEGFQNGAADANGQPPERHISDGSGLPCRHCLEDIERGEPYLIPALRPFPALQPYAELGPIFLHAHSCLRYAPQTGLPKLFASRKTALIKGYSQDNRVKYGTGRIVGTAHLLDNAGDIFQTPDVGYIHVRSAHNNCYTCRIDKAGHIRV